MERTGILRLVNRYWNGATAIGDAIPGSSVAGYTGQPAQYAGQLGAVVYLTYADATKRNDPLITVGPLQGGRYQYAQFAADGTAYAQGQILYWKDETSFIVTNVPPASLIVAGVCLCPVTQGNYWIFQTEGVVGVLFAAGLTTPAVNESIHANNATPSLAVNAATAATAILAGGNAVGLCTFLGVPKTAPVSSTISLIFLRGLPEVN